MQDTIVNLIENAKLYKQADTALENVCGNALDPISCTVFALKNKHTEGLPVESFNAATYLSEVVRLHGVLVNVYNMDSDVVRAIWLPILS